MALAFDVPSTVFGRWRGALLLESLTSARVDRGLVVGDGLRISGAQGTVGRLEAPAVVEFISINARAEKLPWAGDTRSAPCKCGIVANDSEDEARPPISMNRPERQEHVPPALPGAQERLQLALDAGAITGTWFWDVVADRFTADRRLARCFSLDEKRMEAGVRLAEVVQSIHPDDEPRVQRLISTALVEGGPYRAEYRVRQLDGGYRWIEANGNVTLDPAGQALTFPGVLVDVHGRFVPHLVMWLRLFGSTYGGRVHVASRAHKSHWRCAKHSVARWCQMVVDARRVRLSRSFNRRLKSGDVYPQSAARICGAVSAQTGDHGCLSAVYSRQR